MQVKSKARGAPVVKLKLSNALRFAKDPGPCFLVLFLASEGGEPVKIFARHFWERELSAVLRRGRQAGESADLHTQTISFSFSDDDDHTSDLIAWMQATLGGIGDRYADLKSNMVRTLGLDDGWIHGSIAFDVADLEALVDHQIGLPSPAPLTNVTIKQRRFGIDAPQPIISGKPDFVNMRVHPTPCRVRVQAQSSRDLWLDAELFAPAIPDLPEALLKLRIVAGFLEILILAGNRGKIDLNVEHHQPLSLAMLRSMTTLRLMAVQGSLDIQLFVEGRLVYAADATLARHEDPWIDAVPNALDCLETAVAGVAPSDFSLSFADIFAAWDGLVDFAGLVAGANLTIDCVFASPPDQAPESRTFVAYDYLDIGRWTILAVVARPILEASVDGKNVKVACGAPKVVEARVLLGSGAEALPELQAMYRRAIRGGQDAFQMFEGSYRAMIAKFTGPDDKLLE